MANFDRVLPFPVLPTLSLRPVPDGQLLLAELKELVAVVAVVQVGAELLTEARRLGIEFCLPMMGVVSGRMTPPTTREA